MYEFLVRDLVVYVLTNHNGEVKNDTEDGEKHDDQGIFRIHHNWPVTRVVASSERA